MMYHFMFGFLGGSPLAATPSTPGGGGSCSPPAAASFFSSSGIWGASSRPAFRLKLVNPEIVEQRGYAVLNDEINHSKVQRENEDRDHDHRGRGANFFPRRRGDLTHFAAYVVVERLDALRPGLDLVAKTSTGCHD